MAHGVYINLTYTRHRDHVSLVAQICQKYATADYCTKKVVTWVSVPVENYQFVPKPSHHLLLWPITA